MYSSAEEFTCYQIANAPLRSYPFPHFYVCPVFPPDFYADLLAGLPGPESYTRIDKTGSVPPGVYKERFVASLTDLAAQRAGNEEDAWCRLAQWMLGEHFLSVVFEKFMDDVKVRFGGPVQLQLDREARLVRDYTNYEIAPHTDTTRKLVSLLFYMPADDRGRGMGTSIYVPKDPTQDYAASDHHSFEEFRHVVTMDYVPNSLFAFLRTDTSFHGVARIADPGVERNLLLYNVYVKGAFRPKEPPRRRWPWQRESARS